MDTPYLDIARTGKTDWWRYLIAAPAILAAWIGFGMLPILALLIYVSMDGDPATTLLASGRFAGVHPLVEFSATMLSFIPLFAAVLLAMPILHKRPPRTLVTAGRISWRTLFYGMAGWFGLAIVISAVEAALFPGRYQFAYAAGGLSGPALAQFVLLLGLSLVLIPLQTSAEELVFRGYLLQWAGLRLRNPWVLSLISGLAFALPHLGNPEVRVDFVLVMFSYFLMGAFLAWITLRWQGLELALGVHAGNNLFASLAVTYSNGALATPALFICNTLDPVYGLISLVAAMAVFYFVALRMLR